MKVKLSLVRRADGMLDYSKDGPGAFKSVWRDGRIVRPAVVASGDAGVLYFEGSAGSYSLRR